MAKTIRWYHKLGISYNPYWYRHEVKYIRSLLHRRFRHNNRVAVNNGKKAVDASRLAEPTKSAKLSRMCIDIQIEPKTRGWITF